MQHKYTIYSSAILISVALTLLQLSNQAAFIPDTLHYLRTAIAFQDAGFQAALSSYSWPFYSVLIATTQQLTGSDMLSAAYLLNGLCQAWLVLSFVALVASFQRDNTTLIAAAILILLYSRLNTLRPDILRDFAYWASLLTALIGLVRYIDSQKFRHALLWSMFALVSFLFRVEGIIIALVLPWIVLSFSNWTWRQKLVSLTQLHSVSVLAIIVVTGLLWLVPDAVPSRAMHLPHSVQVIFSQMGAQFSQASNQLAQDILPSFIAKHAYLVLLTGLLSVFIMLFCKALTPTYGFLCLYALFNQVSSQIKAEKMRCLLAFILINFIICLTYFAWRYFIVSRYLMAMNLGVLVWVSLGFSSLLGRVWRGQAQRLEQLFFTAVCIGLFTMAMHSVDRHFSKSIYLSSENKYQYLKQAGLWLQSNMPSNVKLYSNDDSIRYYAAKDKRAWLKHYRPSNTSINLQAVTSGQFQWFALNIPKRQQETTDLLAKMPLTEVVRFTNRRGDQVIIYRCCAEQRHSLPPSA